ncbi:SRPBCC family protein [Kitasatospora sp. SUK 42]|uniref:SRPBCC family protein n=1 Tax=Kitasatospora sp. SUK 42 TaxID=1588882 RepID=UPI0018CAE38E|nr:SRPBCC family protein [Kitasatospora sp. SUK 42]MBV2156754.1 SRPBCC family protein [Kitasatospora sp. SUK 42]
MPLDVTVERVIPLPPEAVAAYAMDWRHDTEWTRGIRSAALTREADTGGFGVGAEVTRTARFLGRSFDYVLRVAGYAPPRMLDLVSVAGPGPLQMTYTFEPTRTGTFARIRVRGGSAPHHLLAAPLISRQVRTALTADLHALEARLTAPGAPQ